MSPANGDTIDSPSLLSGGVPSGKKGFHCSTHWDSIDWILRHGALKPPNELKFPNIDLI
jgi:hypothetical protein